MKKIYIAMAVLAAELLSSCVQEKNFNKITVGENEIAFVMEGVSTRSADGASHAVKGLSLPMGDGIILEETIEELNPGPATKGAPAYTENLIDVYPTMGVYAAGNFGDAVFGNMDSEQYLNDGWRYNHEYGFNPWPNETDPVTFYLRMPVAGKGVTYSDETKTSFELTSPLKGLEQEDLLFGQVTMNKKQHDAELPGGYPVEMKHALTGIKFANGHPNDHQTRTIITKVEIIGLNKYGKGTVGADGVVTWDNTVEPVLSTEAAPFVLEFDNPAYSEGNDGTVSKTGDKKWDAGLDGTSWTAAAADHNLNHANGELTFWFVPQEISDDVVLNLEFYVKTPDTPDGTLIPHTIELGKLLNGKSKAATGKNLEWKAGQLRTYTLMPYDVDVEIKDKVTNTVKSNLHVANTGNVDEYVRMLIMGNWYGWKPGTTESQMTIGSPDYIAPSILVGYVSPNTSSKEMVKPWYGGGYKNAQGVYEDPYGEYSSDFTLGKLGDRDGKKNDWADASGGYYFTMPIGPGEGVDSQSATKDLFTSYEVKNVPTIYLPVGGTREPAVGVHLVMEIVIQAIAVPKDENGNDVWWLQAWYDATGIPKLNPEATDSEGNLRNKKFVDYYNAGEYNPE